MIDLSKAVFLLDGRTEIRSFKWRIATENALDLAARKTNCNGKHVTADGYASSVLGVMLEVLGQRFMHIVCILDRESRLVSSQRFATSVRRAIVTSVLGNSHYGREDVEAKLRVCVPDRMFENWIIADIEGIKQVRNLVKATAEQAEFDGKNGARYLRDFMTVPYKKASHGPVLFQHVDYGMAGRNSPSFRAFTLVLGWSP